jgi:hypothetical protein
MSSPQFQHDLEFEGRHWEVTSSCLSTKCNNTNSFSMRKKSRFAFDLLFEQSFAQYTLNAS